MFFADTIFHLRKEVTDGFISSTLEKIESDGFTARFVDDGGYRYIYAYLVEPPAEPKYKPFENVDKAMNAITKHGGWVKDVEAHRTLLVHAYEKNDSGNNLMVGFSWISLQDLYEIFVFADDGSPCGELVEE